MKGASRGKRGEGAKEEEKKTVGLALPGRANGENGTSFISVSPELFEQIQYNMPLVMNAFPWNKFSSEAILREQRK